MTVTMAGHALDPVGSESKKLTIDMKGLEERVRLAFENGSIPPHLRRRSRLQPCVALGAQHNNIAEDTHDLVATPPKKLTIDMKILEERVWLARENNLISPHLRLRSVLRPSTIVGVRNDTFTMFPTLPIELRTMVWKASIYLERPRVVEVMKCREAEGFFSSTRITVALTVCHESRAVAQLTHPLYFASHNGPKRIRADLTRDTIFLTEHLTYSICEFSDFLEQNVLDRLRYLALDISGITGKVQTGYFDYVDMSKASYTFVHQIASLAAETMTDLKKFYVVIQAHKVVADFDKIPDHQLLEEFRSTTGKRYSHKSGSMALYRGFPKRIRYTERWKRLRRLPVGPYCHNYFQPMKVSLRYGWAGNFWDGSFRSSR